MVAAGVELHAVKAGLVVALAAVDELLDLGLDLLGGLHVAGADAHGGFELVAGRGGGGATRSHHHVHHLAQDERVVLVHRVSDGRVGGDAVVGREVEARRVDLGEVVGVALTGGRVFAAHHRRCGQAAPEDVGGLEADHADAALGELLVVGQARVAGPIG